MRFVGLALGAVAASACGRFGFEPAAGPVADGAVDAGDAGVDGVVEPIRFVQEASATAIVSPLSIDVAPAAAIGAGHVLIVAVDYGYSGVAPSLVLGDSLGSTFTFVRGPGGPPGMIQYLAYAPVQAGGLDTVTARLTGSPSFFNLRVHEYAGLALTNTLDVATSSFGTTGSSPAFASDPLTTAGPNEVLVGAAVAGGIVTAGAGMTVRSMFAADVVEELLAPVSGTYQLTARVDTSTWVFTVAAFRGQ